MLPLRVCYLQHNWLFNEYCDLPISPWRDLTDTMLSGFNLSLVAKDPSLQYLTNKGKEIDECLLSIERNDSDVVFLPYTMPVIMNNIKNGPVFFSDKIVIASAYKFENSDANPGIFDTFDAFGIDAVTLILNFFVILTALICLTYILERKSLSRRVRINGRRFNLRFVPWFVFCFFAKQFPSFPGSMTVLKVLLTCCLLTFSYFVTFFYSSMIKTDMVTVKAPRIIGSYQDILDDPQIEPYIRHVLDEYTSFKDAPSGSPKKKIWERIVKMGVNRLVYNNATGDKNKDGDANTAFLQPHTTFMHTKAVVMAYAGVINFGKYLMALQLKTLETLKIQEPRRMLLVSDPTEIAKLSVSVMNRMTIKDLSMKYEGRMRRFFEGHFYQKYIDNTGLVYAKLYADIMGLGKDISDAHEYINQRVLLPEPVLVKANITYFMSLFISCLVLCFIQFIVFIIERWVSDRDKNRILLDEQ